MNGKSYIVLLSVLTLLLVIITGGCTTSCSGGMCSLNCENLTESQVREKASVFAYEKLLTRQENPKIAIRESGGKEPYSVEQIDPASWQVTRDERGWKLKRYFAGDFWHIVECNLDGSKAIHFYEIGPVLEPSKI